jgi:3-hydroxybutyryl-CoA dehydrogenase
MAAKQSGIVIIGGGIMGGDIATIFAAGNWAVHVMSPSQKTRDALPARVSAGLGKLGADAGLLKNLRAYETLKEIDWAGVDLVIEAATENLELKRKIFSELETLARPEIPLTSNTSNFQIGEIGKHLKTRSRVAGVHYFMPAHLVPLVEIIKADFTDVKVCDWLEENQRSLGKMPVRVNKDIPGFIGNRLQHAMMREALYLISEGVVSPEGVDAAVRYGFGFRFLACGPMMQKEMSGWDTNYYAASSLYADLHAEKVAAPVVKAMIDKGHLGMKTKQGMWSWDDDGIKQEKGRIEKVLQQALTILNADIKK